MRALLVLALLACERAPASEPEPTPPPTPIPAPRPSPVIPTTPATAITIVLTTTDLWLEGSLVLEVKPTTTPEDITEAFERQLGRLDRPRWTEIIFRGEAAVSVLHVNAVVIAAKNAGFSNLTFKAL